VWRPLKALWGTTDEIGMADKRRLGLVVPLRAPKERKRRNTPPLDVSSREMIEAEQDLFMALREVLPQAARPNQAETQPPPSTSSSRKKTAA
jgi:hypothetical protein